jgi:hypothetical protein
MFELSPCKNSLSESFKIYILLSHVKLYKMKKLTRALEQKNFPKKTRFFFWENGSLEGKTDQNRGKNNPIFYTTDHRSVFGLLKTDRFWFWSRFPKGLY